MKKEGEAVKNGSVSAIHGVARPGVYNNRGYIKTCQETKEVGEEEEEEEEEEG